MTDQLLYPLLLIGDLIFLFIIFLMVKHEKLSVRFSLVWFGLGGVLLVLSAFPVLAKMLRALFHFEVVANMIFTLLFCFVLLVLLLFSAEAGFLSERVKRLSQSNALLERRVRQLEEALRQKEND